MLRWIAFDVVGTLMYPDPGVAEAYALIGQKYGSQQTTSDLRLRFRSVFAESIALCLPNDDGHIVTSEELETQRWRWIVEQMLHDVTDPAACFADLYDHFARPTSWRLFDDVISTLDRLRTSGFRLALASNYDHRLYDVCRGFPVLQTMDRIVISTEAGACKPSPRFFESLLRACECRPEELLMVGDEVEADVTGPAQVGIKSVLIDRGAEAGNAIRSLDELFSQEHLGVR